MTVQSYTSEVGIGPRLQRLLASIPTWILWFLVVVWSLPTFGLFVNSFRDADAQRNTGWWTAFVGEGSLTIENYDTVLRSGPQGGLWNALLNSFAIAIPATVIPIAIAAFAAYAFAWMSFRGRSWLFVGTVSLLAIPLQVALIPLLQMYSGGAHWTIPFFEKTVSLFPDLNLQGTVTSVWLTHTGFALPFAIFLLHNYISGLPKDVFESAYIDGADHFTIFWRLVVPLSVPVLAAFAIFQFLWTWNDLLVAKVFLIDATGETTVMTNQIVELLGTRGGNWEILATAAFVSIAVPLLVFFFMQRYLVRGLLAGSVKGG